MGAKLSRWLTVVSLGLAVTAGTGCRSGGSWTPSWMSWGGKSAETPDSSLAATKPSTQLPPSPSATFSPGPGAVAAGGATNAKANSTVGASGYPTTGSGGSAYGSAPRTSVANGGGYNTGPYNTGVAGGSSYGSNASGGASPTAYTADRRNSNAASSPYGTPYQAAPTGYGSTTTGSPVPSVGASRFPSSNQGPAEASPASDGTYGPPAGPTTTYPQIEMGSPVPSPYSSGQTNPSGPYPSNGAVAPQSNGLAQGGWRPGSTGSAASSGTAAAPVGQEVSPVNYQNAAPPSAGASNLEGSEQREYESSGPTSAAESGNYAPPAGSGFGGGSFIPPN